MEQEEINQFSPTRRKRNDEYSKNGDKLFVSKSPENSSAGFANTFRILENQIQRNKLMKHSSLSSISEEEPSFLELELAARSRLKEMCDTSSSAAIDQSLNNKQFKYDNVQNYIYHVGRNRSGLLTLKPKHLKTTIVSIDDDGNNTIINIFFHKKFDYFRIYCKVFTIRKIQDTTEILSPCVMKHSKIMF